MGRHGKIVNYREYDDIYTFLVSLNPCKIHRTSSGRTQFKLTTEVSSEREWDGVR